MSFAESLRRCEIDYEPRTKEEHYEAGYTAGFDAVEESYDRLVDWVYSHACVTSERDAVYQLETIRTEMELIRSFR